MGARIIAQAKEMFQASGQVVVHFQERGYYWHLGRLSLLVAASLMWNISTLRLDEGLSAIWYNFSSCCEHLKDVVLT